MSKKSKKTSKKKQGNNNRSNTVRSTASGGGGKRTRRTDLISWRGIAASAPGALMVAMVAVMFIADVFGKDMEEKQYVMFPQTFRVVNFLIITAGITAIASSLIDVKSRKRVMRSLRKDRTWLWFAAFGALIAISTLVNGIDQHAIHGVPYRNIGFPHMLAFIFVYMLASCMTDGARLGDAVMNAYVFTADAIALSVLYDKHIGSIEAYQAKKELSAVFFNGNHYGYFLVMAILIGVGMFLYSEGWRAAAGAASAALNTVILAYNHSMGCILAVVTVAVITVITALTKDREDRKKATLLAAGGAACAVAVIALVPEVREEILSLSHDISSILGNDVNGSIGHNRFRIWRFTAGYIAEKPWLGYGCEGMSEKLYIATGISNPHNEPLTYAAYYGIPAAAAYLFGTLSAFKRYMKRRKRLGTAGRTACMAAAGYFLSSLTGVAMFYTLPFFFIFTGMACAVGRND